MLEYKESRAGIIKILSKPRLSPVVQKAQLKILQFAYTYKVVMEFKIDYVLKVWVWSVRYWHDSL